MKKLLTSAIVIAACVALCASVWPPSGAGRKVPAGADNGELGINAEGLAQPASESIIALSLAIHLSSSQQSAPYLTPSR